MLGHKSRTVGQSLVRALSFVNNTACTANFPSKVVRSVTRNRLREFDLQPFLSLRSPLPCLPYPLACVITRETPTHSLW